MTLNEELSGVWRESTLSYLELPSQHFSYDSEESHGNINPYTYGSRIKLGTFNSTGTTFV